MTTRRQERISEALREELTLLVGAELDDELIAEAMVNVTDVEVTPDLRYARVYIEHTLSDDMTPRVLAALKHAESYLRQALGSNLCLRYVPELSFHMDLAGRRGRRVDELLDTIASEDQSADDAGSAATE